MKPPTRMAGVLLLQVITLPVAYGQESPSSIAPSQELSRFEVATIKPSKPDDQGNEGRTYQNNGDRIYIKNFTLRRLIRVAYGLKSDSQVIGGPDWISREAFDIEAKFDDSEVAMIQKLRGAEALREAQNCLRELLEDRFGLHIMEEAKSIPVYALVIAKSAAKLPPSAPQLDKDGNPKIDKSHALNNEGGHLSASAITMSSLANWFVDQPECDRVVVDRTGLNGEYDFKLDWAQDSGHGIPPDAPFPGLFTALHDQLGLELKPDKASVNVVVVKSASQPGLN